MKLLKKSLIIILSLLGLIWISLFTVSHLYYHRSVMATVSEIYLRVDVNKKSTKETESFLAQEKRLGNQKYKLPKNLKLTSSYRKINFHGMPVYIFNPEGKNKSAMLYLHGGAYVHQVSSFQLKAIDNIATKSDSPVVIPMYPSAPHETWKTSYNLLTELYQKMSQYYQKKIILTGDSAGGGLALGLAESFSQKKIVQPDKLILISPWVDITQSNKAEEKYEAKDPILGIDELRVEGKSWAGDLDVNDYHVSPINGNMKELRNVTLFVGTRELFYPDVNDLYKKLLKNNVKVTKYIGSGLNHVYPMYPTPEAKKAQDIMITLMKK